MREKWYRKSYRRHLLDMHYEDWDPLFLSKFEPSKHVEMLKKARVKSAVIFTNSHVGLAFWPASRIPMDKNISGRDIVGETVELFKEAGIDPILYMSFVYDNWAYAEHPEWRIIDASGQTTREWDMNRYGLCCPNSGYREFALAQTEEVCGRYDAVSFHPDMLFWNGVCLCPNCKQRFTRETGYEPPAAIDWNDPVWAAFNNKREEWMTEFTDDICATARKARPGITVSVQSSAVFSPWPRGYAEDAIRGSDYSYGDLYGGFLEESFACKFYHNYSPNLPFQYETNFCDVDWTEHTIRKNPQTMELQAMTAAAHSGAFLFIDPIAPDGSHQNPKIFDEMGKIFEKVERLEPWLGGRICADAGVYFSLKSRFSPEENGVSLMSPSLGMPHWDAATGAAGILAEAHIPCGVFGKRALGSIGQYKLLVLPDVLTMDGEEAEAVRAYVQNGGNLYASGRTFHPLLSEVLGIEPLGETHETVTYVAETAGKKFMPETFSGYPLTIRGRQVTAKPVDPDEVMAVVNLPYTDPADRTRFVYIHSNPPGADTEYPAVIYRAYGKGRVIWASAAFEAFRYEPHRRIFLGLVKKLLTSPPAFECDAPAPVEIVLTHDAENRRFLISLLNLQDRTPVLPVYNFTVRVNLCGNAPLAVLALPDEVPAEYVFRDGFVEIRVIRLEMWAMYGIQYR